jgi:hypothetical protein
MFYFFHIFFYIFINGKMWIKRQSINLSLSVYRVLLQKFTFNIFFCSRRVLRILLMKMWEWDRWKCLIVWGFELPYALFVQQGKVDWNHNISSSCKYLTNNLLCKVNSHFCKVIFSRQNSFFQNTKEKFGGKKLLCKWTWSL